MVVSVYVEGRNADALASTVTELHNLIVRFRSGRGTRTDVILLGDFNQHDQLWGGDDVAREQRQGEADPIIDFIGDFSLHSLLPRGVKTWGRNGQESTIDLVFGSDELTGTLLKCEVYGIEHGSDHRAIHTTFDIAPPERIAVQRLLLQNAPRNTIRQRIATDLQHTHRGLGTQVQTDQLMDIVLHAIHTFTPKAKPSPYGNRWWTSDLTNLRRVYTCQRNQARSYRRLGIVSQNIEQRARDGRRRSRKSRPRHQSRRLRLRHGPRNLA